MSFCCASLIYLVIFCYDTIGYSLKIDLHCISVIAIFKWSLFGIRRLALWELLINSRTVEIKSFKFGWRFWLGSTPVRRLLLELDSQFHWVSCTGIQLAVDNRFYEWLLPGIKSSSGEDITLRFHFRRLMWQTKRNKTNALNLWAAVSNNFVLFCTCALLYLYLELQQRVP
jgi:hypothetical protein